MQLSTRVLDHPARNLIILFLGWKVLLLLVAACSPGPGYDTSGSLLYEAHDSELPFVLRYIVGKLTRWDAIYFVKSSSRGYVFEQEWAFGWGFSRVIALCTSALKKAGVARYSGLEALVAILIAHASHLLSVLVLFSLTCILYPSSGVAFAFTTSVLHILSPAGLFLSAPYAESSCALLSFVGHLVFTKSILPKGSLSLSHDFLMVGSGILFGIAATFRSNAILNGLLLLEEAFRALANLQHGFKATSIRHLLATGLGGAIVGAGFLLPQYIAYQEYCGDSDDMLRPWCEKSLPSIYTFVQEHYWNMGLFRYWTISNAPLFFLGLPMFLILITSGLQQLGVDIKLAYDTPSDLKVFAASNGSEGQVLRNLAFSQLILVVLTLTTAHVQIISRISSSYPVWLWYAAATLQQQKSFASGGIVRFMVIYGIIQGVLFASFLPPA